MKYSILGDTISIRGINGRMELKRFLICVPTVFIGYILFPAILLYSHQFIAKAASCLGLITFSVLLIMLILDLRKAHSNHTIIDKLNHSIVFTSLGKTENCYKGDFKNILIEEVGVGRGVVYKVYMICTEGKIDLGLIASTKRGLRKKIKPLTDFLGLPIEEKLDENVIHIFGK